MSVYLTTIASGSKGNCIYIGTENTKILIDAGISCSKIENALENINLSLKDIDAIFVTHEHSDHINSVGVISRKYNTPIYATEGTWKNMPEKVGKINNINKKVVYQNEDILLNDILIRPFKVPHDAKEPICYSVFYDKTKISIVTDIGYVTKDIIDNIKYSSALVLESNHDINMLKMCNYPPVLKERILSKYGHISNETCGKLLSCVMNNKLKNVFLAHLSRDTNTEELAYLTVSKTLEEFGIQPKKDVNIHIAKPYGITNLIKIEE